MRAANRIGLLVWTTILCAVVHGALQNFALPGDRLYAFIYERGPVQYATLYVACLVAMLLLGRFLKCRWGRGQLESLQRRPQQATGPLREEVAAVAAICEQRGGTAASARIGRLAEERQTEVQRAYETIHFFTGLLPALGLFGTLLGLSDALFAAFSGGVLNSAAIQQFVTGLATAMDTTVLGMACAAPLAGGAWLLSRCEDAVVEQFARYLRQRFDVQDGPAADRTAEVLQAELRRLTQRMAEEAKLAFGKLLETSAQTYREQLEHAVQAVLAAQRAHDERMVHKLMAQVGESLRGSLGTLGEVIKEHNGHMAEAVVREVGHLGTAIRRRTPEEVIIRYQQDSSVNNNGHARPAAKPHP